METVVVFVVLPHVQEDDSDYIILLMSGGRLLGEVFVSHLVAAAVARFLENDSDIVREDLLQEVQDETGHVCGEVHLSEWTRLGESPTIPGMQIIRFTLEGDVFFQGWNADGTRTVATANANEIGGLPNGSKSPATPGR